RLQLPVKPPRDIADATGTASRRRTATQTTRGERRRREDDERREKKRRWGDVTIRHDTRRTETTRHDTT
ncbi:MAG: hypothetical protein ABEJ05_00525, partial [Haloglomus sp.]